MQRPEAVRPPVLREPHDHESSHPLLPQLQPRGRRRRSVRGSFSSGSGLELQPAHLGEKRLAPLLDVIEEAHCGRRGQNRLQQALPVESGSGRSRSPRSPRRSNAYTWQLDRSPWTSGGRRCCDRRCSAGTRRPSSSSTTTSPSRPGSPKRQRRDRTGTSGYVAVASLPRRYTRRASRPHAPARDPEAVVLSSKSHAGSVKPSRRLREHELDGGRPHLLPRRAEPLRARPFTPRARWLPARISSRSARSRSTPWSPRRARPGVAAFDEHPVLRSALALPFVRKRCQAPRSL